MSKVYVLVNADKVMAESWSILGAFSTYDKAVDYARSLLEFPLLVFEHNDSRHRPCWRAEFDRNKFPMDDAFIITEYDLDKPYKSDCGLGLDDE